MPAPENTDRRVGEVIGGLPQIAPKELRAREFQQAETWHCARPMQQWRLLPASQLGPG